MFRIPIYGEIDGKNIRVLLGKRYKISTNDNVFEGTIAKMINNSFLIKTVNGGFWVDFDLINDIEEL